MASLVRLVSMCLHLCCLKSLALLQVWLCSRTSKSLILGDVLVLIKHRFQVRSVYEQSSRHVSSSSLRCRSGFDNCGATIVATMHLAVLLHLNSAGDNTSLDERHLDFKLNHHPICCLCCASGHCSLACILSWLGTCFLALSEETLKKMAFGWSPPPINDSGIEQLTRVLPRMVARQTKSIT
jgi:hypothetical protein